jgi:glucose-6-phosphate isomerase, archaeal
VITVNLDFSWISFDPHHPHIEGAVSSERRLSDLKGYFTDVSACNQQLQTDDPLLYRVYSIEQWTGEGDLIVGFGVLMPGKVGDEYFFTKGHYHAWRPAAEVYVGLSGTGFMLLEDESTHESRLLPLMANSAVYVPGHTAHRTINTGDTPLTYIGINPARAGHDYGSIEYQNFRKVLIEVNGEPVLLDRTAYLHQLQERST